MITLVVSFHSLVLIQQFPKTAANLTYIHKHIYPFRFAMLYTEDLLSTNNIWTQFIEASVDMIAMFKFAWNAIDHKYNYIYTHFFVEYTSVLVSLGWHGTA